jgi:hypothetical protein
MHDAPTKRKYLSADADQHALVDGVRAVECVSVKCMVFIFRRCPSLVNGEILLVVKVLFWGEKVCYNQ